MLNRLMDNSTLETFVIKPKQVVSVLASASSMGAQAFLFEDREGEPLVAMYQPTFQEWDVWYFQTPYDY